MTEGTVPRDLEGESPDDAGPGNLVEATLIEAGEVDGTLDGPDDADPAGGRRSGLRSILLRLHFFGGFFAAPIALWLALTGILFAWNPQIESVLHGDQRDATAEGMVSPVADQVEAALAAYPGHEVAEVTPSRQAGTATAVLLEPVGAAPAGGFGPAPGAFTAYVDPVDTTVTGRIAETSRPDEWIRNLHSNFRLGDRAGTLTELAASWVVVSLATGLYLWWPRTRRAWRSAARPRLRGLGTGRRAWRDLHAAVGVVLLGVLAVLVVTGLTWTEYAGRWVDVTKDAVSTEAPVLQTDLAVSSPGDGAPGGGHHGAAGEAGSPGEATGTEAGAAHLGDIDRVVAAADGAGARRPFTVAPAGEAGQAWTVTEVDDRWPIRAASFAVDPATGQVVDRLEFGDKPLLDRATSLGIGFHEGSLFGPVNQVLLTVVALALVVLLASGYVMWWRRRPSGFGPPPKLGSLLRDVPLPVWAGFVVLMVLLPTMGVSFLIYLVGERVVRSVHRAKATGSVA